VKIVAIANQKGGVGKTSTTVNLAAALARRGLTVLMVDLDPQASLTEYFTDPTKLDTTIYNMLIENAELQPITLGEYINLLPANIDLAAAEIQLPSKRNQERTLARHLKRYYHDYCLIDCPPSLGVLTTNALTAANLVIIPVTTELMGERTLKLILNTIDDVRDSELNPTLKVWRILPSLHNAQLSHHKEILAVLKTKHGSLLYPEPVKLITKYKDAVTSQTDVSDLDRTQGEYWDRLADLLAAESEVTR
jgi:chromosome partitioning protein